MERMQRFEEDSIIQKQYLSDICFIIEHTLNSILVLIN